MNAIRQIAESMAENMAEIDRKMNARPVAYLDPLSELAWFRSWTTRAFGPDRSKWPDEDREWVEREEAKGHE